MRKLTFGVIVLFLAFLGAAYMQKTGRFGWGGSLSVSTSAYDVSWNTENVKWNEQVSITFTLQDEEGENVRGLNDTLHSKVRIVIVSPNFDSYERIRPSFLGKGEFSFSHTFSEKGTYGMFVYIEGNGTEHAIAGKQVDIEIDDKEKKQASSALEPDPLLTTKIGPYQASLIFNALSAGQEEKLTIQFEDPSLRLSTLSGDVSHLFVFDEERMHFIYAVADDTTDDSALSFYVTFPKEGFYKVWGTLYVNGKKYEHPFVIQVSERR